MKCAHPVEFAAEHVQRSEHLQGTRWTGGFLDHAGRSIVISSRNSNPTHIARFESVGCGQGAALKLCAARGADAVGVTLNQTDGDVCRSLGYDVRYMDQSFLDFPDASFDVLWCQTPSEGLFALAGESVGA